MHSTQNLHQQKAEREKLKTFIQEAETLKTKFKTLDSLISSNNSWVKELATFAKTQTRIPAFLSDQFVNAETRSSDHFKEFKKACKQFSALKLKAFENQIVSKEQLAAIENVIEEAENIPSDDMYPAFYPKYQVEYEQLKKDINEKCQSKINQLSQKQITILESFNKRQKVYEVVSEGAWPAAFLVVGIVVLIGVAIIAGIDQLIKNARIRLLEKEVDKLWDNKPFQYENAKEDLKRKLKCDSERRSLSQQKLFKAGIHMVKCSKEFKEEPKPSVATSAPKGPR